MSYFVKRFAESLFRVLFFLGVLTQLTFNPIAGTLIILLGVIIHFFKDALELMERYEHGRMGSYVNNMKRAVRIALPVIVSMIIIYLIRGFLGDDWIILEMDQFIYLLTMLFAPLTAALLSLVFE